MEIEIDETTTTTNNSPTKTTTPLQTQTNKDNNYEVDDDWNKIEFKKRHTIYALAETCQGETQSEKRYQLEEQILEVAHLLSISTKKIGESHMIKLDLVNMEDKMAVCHMLEENKIEYRMSLKGKEADPTDNTQRNKELVIKDIPLGVTKDAIGRRFSIWGRVNQVHMVVKDGWQTAHIQFEDTTAINPFHTDTWSVFLRKDSLRVIPGENYNEYFTSRKEHTLKLCNLPRGTTAYDISDYIKEVKGKTCFIPRSRGKYERVRYAFVSFETEQDLIDVLENETPIYIKENHVQWFRPEIKTCHICQGTEHMAANCPRIQDRERNERKILKYSDLYRRKKVNTDNVDNIHKKANTITQKKSYLQAARGAIPKDKNTVGLTIEDRLSSLERAMITIQEVLNKIIEKSSLEEEEKANLTQPLETPENPNFLRTPQRTRPYTPKRTQTTPQPKPQTQSTASVPTDTKGHRSRNKRYHFL